MFSLRSLSRFAIPVPRSISRFANMIRANISPANPLVQEGEEESYRIAGGFKIVERWFEVPLDYFNPSSDTIKVFARNAIPNKKNDNGESGAKLPYFVYLQGGPGFGCNAPNYHPITNFLFEKGYQVLYLDQRGTGLSTPISPLTLSRKGTAQEQADYLKLFRADNIVRDCESIRLSLLPKNEKWSVIGHSFGGFCATTYLSLHPEGLKEVFTTGGMPPLVNKPDEVYTRTYRKVQSRNKVYYKKYPKDIKRVRNILTYLCDNKIVLPTGGNLSPERFLGLGLSFGAHGGIDSVHLLVQRAANDLGQFGALTYKTMQSIESHQSFDGNIIYAICHESIYCQGEASGWSAQRVLDGNMEQFSHFSWSCMSQTADTEPVFFTGEMIYLWMFSDYHELRKVSDAADILAYYRDWPQLYDEAVLAQNTVPVYAATYIEDMYVEYEFARETASKIKGAKEFITNTMFHNAVRNKTDAVMGELWKLKVGEED